jgi:hypothetical protein
MGSIKDQFLNFRRKEAQLPLHSKFVLFSQTAAAVSLRSLSVGSNVAKIYPPGACSFSNSAIFVKL